MSLLPFIFISIVLLSGALAAFALRNTVHCALGAALAFVALACFYISLGAEFIGFVQILVYVGAIAILVVFVILLTRPERSGAIRIVGSAIGGLLTAAVVLGALLLCVFKSPSLAISTIPASAPQTASIKAIGLKLMSTHLLPLESVAVLLTAALIGAVLFAWDEKTDGESDDADAAADNPDDSAL